MDRPDNEPRTVQPFLTIDIIEGDTGASAVCPELDASMNVGGTGKRDTAINGLLSIVDNLAEGILSRVRSEKLTGDISPEKIVLARRITEAKELGIPIKDLFQEPHPSL